MICFNFGPLIMVSSFAESHYGPKTLKYEPITAEKRLKYAWLSPENVIFKGSMGCEV